MNKRLINYFKPEHYDLFLNLDKTNRRFGGTVTITGQSFYDHIFFHTKQLKIKNVIVDGTPTNDFEVENDIMCIKKSGSKIRIDFSGTISDTLLHGLYICKYRYNNQPCELMATQFEANHACELFPCIDEPAAKATFKLTVQTAEPVVLSNMPGKHVKNAWEFEETPRMSTYLLAIVAGDLHNVSAKTKSGVTVNVYATPAHQDDTLQYALSCATKIIDFYEDYFGVKYPLPKSDHIALPDFAVGAMENWGLITYRETGLVCPVNAAQDNKEYTAIVLAHELAHQWFGNLVTMQWWNDLWLNESFASLMEHFAVDHLFPEYNIWSDFEAGMIPAALHRDAIQGVQTVRQDVEDPEAIDTLFDSAIVYAKGERLLKMLFSYIGEDAFRDGLHHYFKDLAYRNATATDLWQHLSQAANCDVAKLMTPWLTRPGYPLINASYQEGKLTLAQTRYLADGAKLDDEPWPVPLFSNPKLPISILDKASVELDLPNLHQLELNQNDDSHFITNYDHVLWDNITSNYGNLSSRSKIKLIREAIMLAKSAHKSFTTVVDLLDKNEHERNFMVWDMITAACFTISSLFNPRTDELTAWRTYLQKFIADEWQYYSNADLTDRDTLKSFISVFSLAISAKYQPALDYAEKLYHNHSADIASLPTDYRSLVLGWAIRYDNAFDKFFAAYRTTNDINLKQDLCAALTGTHLATEGDQLRAACLNLSIVKPQDTLFFIARLMRNPYQRDATWQWIQTNWSWLMQTFAGDMILVDFIKVASGTLSSTKSAEEFTHFFNTYQSDPAFERAIKMGRQEIATHLVWRQRGADEVTALLKQRKLLQ